MSGMEIKSGPVDSISRYQVGNKMGREADMEAIQANNHDLDELGVHFSTIPRWEICSLNLLEAVKLRANMHSAIFGDMIDR